MFLVVNQERKGRHTNLKGKKLEMVVSELIKELQKMPPDMMVVCIGEHVDGCRINDEYYDCDPCRPDAYTITVVELI